MPKKTKVKANKNKLKKETMLDKIKKFFNKFKIAKPKTTSQIIRMFFKDFDEQNCIMQLDKNHYSVCFEYQDISFAKANYETQENIFLKTATFFLFHASNLCKGSVVRMLPRNHAKSMKTLYTQR